MRLRRQLNLAIYSLCSVVILVGCGRAEPFDAVNVASERHAPIAFMRAPAPLVAADQAIAFSRWLAGVRWRDMIAFAEATAAVHRVPSTPPGGATRAVVSASSLGNCGGDLPPCFVKQRESGGSYAAYNPTGCGGYSCGGAWQFDPRTWDNYGGYQYAQDAPSEVQDAKARELWADGAGASHWGVG